VLDAGRICPKCGQKCRQPKYVGRVFHDFRRTAAYQMREAGSTKEECMKVTGHTTQAMFDRYTDLFSEEEECNRQREVQRRRHEVFPSLPVGRDAGASDQASDEPGEYAVSRMVQ
jgi:integrase